MPPDIDARPQGPAGTSAASKLRKSSSSGDGRARAAARARAASCLCGSCASCGNVVHSRCLARLCAARSLSGVSGGGGCALTYICQPHVLIPLLLVCALGVRRKEDDCAVEGWSSNSVQRCTCAIQAPLR